jgi:Domain of unknown function (DUF1707)
MSFGSVVTLGLLIPSSYATASTPELSTVVIGQTLPGLVLDPPGPANGVITRSNADQLTSNMLSGSSALENSRFEQQLVHGDVSAYLRTWSRQSPQNGDAAVVLALDFSTGTQAGSYLGLLNEGMTPATTATIEVFNMAGATGIVQHQPLSGQPGTEYIVTFARGSTVFEVVLATVTDDITDTDAVSVASLQAARAQGAVQPAIEPTTTLPLATVSSTAGTSDSASRMLGLAAVFLFAVIAGLFLKRRHRRNLVTVAPAFETPNMGILASDENRDRVAEQLNFQFIAGRLTLDDLNDRLEATLVARTIGDLYTVTKDLPPD